MLSFHPFARLILYFDAMFLYSTARSCKELLDLGVTRDGSNQVAPDDEDNGIVVWCDQTTDGEAGLFSKDAQVHSRLFSQKLGRNMRQASVIRLTQPGLEISICHV